MREMTRYYISRAIITAAFGGLLALSGMSWWMAALTGLTIFALFLWAPRSGRYAVHPELGATALRRDERTQVINNKAGRNAFVITALCVAGLIGYYGFTAQGDVPIQALNIVLTVGILTYFATDFWLRRT
jgi:hypothetical protein